MKLIHGFLWITFLLFVFAPSTQAQYLWANGEGGSGVDIGKGIKIDNNGDLLVYGDVAGDPVFQNILYKGKGLADGFVAKYATDGSIKWVKIFGGNLVDRINGADVDQNGNIYIVGTFEDTLSVDGLGVRSAGRKDIFIAKLNPSGQTQWLKRFGGAASENPTSIVSDKNGAIYITGTYSNQLNFGNLSINTTNIYEETFIAKLSDTGNPIWAKTAKAQNPNAANSLALMPDGGIVLCGYFSLKFKFDSIEVNTSSSNYEIFIARLDANGNVLWISQAGSAYEDVANAIATDAAGNIAIAGYSAGVAFFDTLTVGNSGYNDPFIAKYNQDGKCAWAKRGAGLDLDIGYGVAFDQYGNVFSTGFFDKKITFDSQLLQGVDKDIFTVSYSPTGNLRWLKSAGSNGTDCGLGIAVNNTNEVFTTGYYLYKADFDNIHLPLGNAEDIFVSKFTQPLVGIKDLNESYISVFPNPVTHGKFTMDNGRKAMENGEWRMENLGLFDIKGKRIDFTVENGVINVSHFASGIYLLSIQMEEGVFHKKIVIVN